MRHPSIAYVLGIAEPPRGPNVKTVLLTFPTDAARDRFLKLLHAQATGEVTASAVDEEKTKSDNELITQTLRTVRFDPQIKADHERTVALFVSGRKMIEGTLADLQKRFKQEADSHKASVDLKEFREGKWVTIQSRRLQRQLM